MEWHEKIEQLIKKAYKTDILLPKKFKEIVERECFDDRSTSLFTAQEDFEIDCCLEFRKRGEKVRFCPSKRMFIVEDDCKMPCYGEGCVRLNADKTECQLVEGWSKPQSMVKKEEPKEKPIELAEPQTLALGEEGLLEVLNGENAEEEGDHIKRLKEDFDRKMRKMEDWVDQRK